MSEWQPIETAPKDGTLVDLWISSKVDEGVGQRVSDCFCDGVRWHDGCAFVEDEWYRPTHWMPLPTAPETKP
jgi:hypothetical protein